MPTEVLPGIYDITVREDENGRRYRAYLVDADVPTLFDTGLEGTTETLLDGIRSTGLTPARTVLTHADPDHTGGLAAVDRTYETETHVPTQSDLATDFEADHRYGDGDRIGPFEAIHVPGHSEDLHALVDEDRGVLVAGDALAGADLRGFPEGYLLPHAAVYAEDYGMAELNLDSLLAYEFDAALVYHGSSVLEDARQVLERFLNFPGRPAEPVR